MRNTVKTLLALAVAIVVMLLVRAAVVTICCVEGEALQPTFLAGDRVVVNRWSYGLRTGEKGSLFDYGRICRQEIKKGDFIAFEDAMGKVLICRCAALPGDTIFGKIVPGLLNCADQDYYWVESLGKNNATDSRQLGFIPEERIIGRACLILYNHHPKAAFWKGYMKDRLLLLP